MPFHRRLNLFLDLFWLQTDKNSNNDLICYIKSEAKIVKKTALNQYLGFFQEKNSIHLLLLPVKNVTEIFKIV
ncbi:hypothetical protein SAMN06265367_103384 [Algoriphagus winogradskyi]|uniref:Uncharacterized protein n=1 Tax=Algoriphagus winogradskyi TaxID=237017 RepID=A0ABY1NYD1_9BACT|nr:hypothetical protein SAMN06265367_103384 [Algoriphagus winogradskyi]